jgi:hypothetical protein
MDFVLLVFSVNDCLTLILKPLCSEGTKKHLGREGRRSDLPGWTGLLVERG